MRSRAYVYSPFLMTAGGGERYFAETVAALSRCYTTTILVHAQQAHCLGHIATTFSVPLSDVDTIILRGGSPYSDASASEIAGCVPPDGMFFQFTNGEFIDLRCRRNISHVQIVVPRSGDPVPQPDKVMRFGMWLQGVDVVVYPSRYVMREMRRRYPTDHKRTHYVHPPLHPGFFLDGERSPFVQGSENTISVLSVGRFTPVKKHDLVIGAFRKLLQLTTHRLRLLIAGPSDTTYLPELKSLATGMDVQFLVGLNTDEMRRLYSQSTMLWSATGFDEGEFGLVETFGLAIAEAMSCGCVPIVASGGGVEEIVNDDVDGYVVETLSELIDRSIMLLDDPRKRQSLSGKAALEVERFRVEAFSRRMLDICGGNRDDVD